MSSEARPRPLLTSQQPLGVSVPLLPPVRTRLLQLWPECSRPHPMVLLPDFSSCLGHTRGPPTWPSVLQALRRPSGDGMTPRILLPSGGLTPSVMAEATSTLSRCSGGQGRAPAPTPGLPQVHPDAEGPPAPDGVGQPGRRALLRVQEVSVRGQPQVMRASSLASAPEGRPGPRRGT